MGSHQLNLTAADDQTWTSNNNNTTTRHKSQHNATRRDRYERVREQAPPEPPLQPGDVEGVMRRIAVDFDNGYFITGVIDRCVGFVWVLCVAAGVDCCGVL